MLVAEVVPVVADVETLGAEAADVDAIADRVKIGTPDVDILKEPDAADLEVDRDEPAHFGRARDALDTGEELVLLAPVLAGRLRHWILADHEPARAGLVLARELLLGIPAARLRVEEAAVEHADVEEVDRIGRRRDDGVVIFLAPPQDVFRRDGVVERSEILFLVDHRRDLHDLLGRDEVDAEDRLRQRIVRLLRRKTLDAFQYVGLELAAALEEPLEALLVEAGLAKGLAASILHETLVLGTLFGRDRPGGRHRRSPVPYAWASGCLLIEASFL